MQFRYAFFTTGIGVHEDPLVSFELALRNAGIEFLNLVPVSSILPPNVKIIPKEEGIKLLKSGQVAYVVLAKYTSNEDGKEIFASIGYAIPEDPNKYGYFTEYYGYWEDKHKTYAGEIAKYLLESKGIKVKEFGTIYVKAKVKKYTTVIAVAVLI